MGNPSNGPAAVIWLNLFCLGGYYVSMLSGHTWSQVVKLVIVEPKDLNNEGLEDHYGSQIGHIWSHMVTGGHIGH